MRPAASEVERLYAGIDKAERLLGWQPLYGGRDGFRRGLAETIAWFGDAGQPQPLQGRPLQHLMNTQAATEDDASPISADEVVRRIRAVLPASEARVALHEPRFSGNERAYLNRLHRLRAGCPMPAPMSSGSSRRWRRPAASMTPLR